MRKTLARIFLTISIFSLGIIATLILLPDLDKIEPGETAGPVLKQNLSKSDTGIESDLQTVITNLNNIFVNIAESSVPSVVTIRTTKVVDHPRIPGSPFEDFFGEDFFDRFMPRGEYKSTALGSGVLVRSHGYILTNNHVVSQGEDITVKLSDGREFKAEEVLTDPRSDLAVIRIDEAGLSAMSLGDSDELNVGEWVIAIGSPFTENLQHTVTAGIVSAKGRTDIINRENYEDFIQTDAAINPGNSGGALVNLYGQLVGVNTAIATRTGGYQGIGFAIPINMATKVMNDLIEKGHVVRAYLGVRIQDVDNEIAESMGMNTPHGALVSWVLPGSPAASADIQSGDVLIAVNQSPVRNSSDLRNQISSLTPGKEYSITLIREGGEKTIQVELDELPEDLTARTPDQPAPEQYFGMVLHELTPGMTEQFDIEGTITGVLVIEVSRGSEAYKKGVRPGDVITHVGLDEPISGIREYRGKLRTYKPGESVLLKVRSGDNSFFAAFTIPE